MCCEGDVHCGVWHWWGNTAPRCTSKADGKRCLLLHVPAAPPSSSAQEKTTTPGDTEPHHSSWKCKKSHRSALTDLSRRWEWESLEHPPYSLDMSPVDYYLFVKVKEPLRGPWCNTKRLIYPCYRTVNTEHQQRWMRWWSTTPTEHLAKKVINYGRRLRWRYINVVLLWIKPCQKYRTVAITFYLTLLFTRLHIITGRIFKHL